MQVSKLPFKMWYLAMAFMTFSKKGISTKEMQRQLGHKYYEPIWLMMHKIREAMGQRDDIYNLKDMVEFDEAYVSVATGPLKTVKRGRGSQKKSNVAIMAESIPLEESESGKKSKSVRYFKMKVLENHKVEGVDEVLKNNLDGKNIVFSDKSTSYINIINYVEVHVSEIFDEQTTNHTLRWVHIAIANLKRNLLGVFHMIKGEYLQRHLNEFCYKLNRRYFGEKLFDRLVIAAANAQWQLSILKIEGA